MNANSNGREIWGVVERHTRVVKFPGIYSPGNISKFGSFLNKFKLKYIKKSIGKFQWNQSVKIVLLLLILKEYNRVNNLF